MTPTAERKLRSRLAESQRHSEAERSCKEGWRIRAQGLESECSVLKARLQAKEEQVKMLADMIADIAKARK